MPLQAELREAFSVADGSRARTATCSFVLHRSIRTCGASVLKYPSAPPFVRSLNGRLQPEWPWSRFGTGYSPNGLDFQSRTLAIFGVGTVCEEENIA